MPLSESAALLIGSGIAAAGSAASQVANGVQAGNLNGRNRRWQERMMNLQRNWSLQDWNRDATFNREMQRESQKWDAAEWTRRFNEENAYNTPVAQMQRLRAAGINPFYALNAMDSGSASGASGSGLSAATSPSHAGVSPVGNPYQHFAPVDFGSSFDRFADSLMKKASIENIQSQTKSYDLENVFKDAVMADKIFQYKFQSKEMRSMMPYLQQMAELNFRQANASYENTLANTSALYAHEQFERDQVTLDKQRFALEKEMQAFNMTESKRLNNAQIQQWAALTTMYGQQAAFLKAQTWHEYWKGYNTILTGNGIYLDNKQKEWIRPYVLSMYQSNAAIAEENAKYAPYQNTVFGKYIQPNLGSFFNGLGIAGGLYLGVRNMMNGKPISISGFK